MLKRRYPYAHVTKYKLRNVYKEKKIKLKLVRKSKEIPGKVLPNFTQDLIEYTEDMRSAIDAGFRIVQLDEMMVTKTTMPKRDWAKIRQNSLVEYQNMDTNPIAVIGAVSREYGLDALMTFPKSINKARFLVFLQKIRDRFPFEDIVLVMDNLGLHKSEDTR